MTMNCAERMRMMGRRCGGWHAVCGWLLSTSFTNQFFTPIFHEYLKNLCADRMSSSFFHPAAASSSAPSMAPLQHYLQAFSQPLAPATGTVPYYGGYPHNMMSFGQSQWPQQSVPLSTYSTLNGATSSLGQNQLSSHQQSQQPQQSNQQQGQASPPHSVIEYVFLSFQHRSHFLSLFQPFLNYQQWWIIELNTILLSPAAVWTTDYAKKYDVHEPLPASASSSVSSVTSSAYH